MSDLNENLIQLRTSFDELEKRIKAIERQTTSSSQLLAVKGCLEEIKILLEDYQSAYQTHITNFNNHLIDLEDLKSTYSEKIGTLEVNDASFESSINNLTNKLTTIETNIKNLISRVTELEENGGTGSGDSESITNWEDVVYFDFAQEFYGTNNNPFYTPYIPFIFDEYGYVDITCTLKFVCDSSVTITPQITPRFSSVNQPVQVLESFTGNKTLTFSRQYLMAGTKNAFRMMINTTGTVKLEKMIVKIHAKNVQIMHNYNPIEIFCFNNNYYITDCRDKTNLKYGIIAKENFTSLSTTLPNSISYKDLGIKFMGPKCYPSIAYGDTLSLSTTNDGMLLAVRNLQSATVPAVVYEKKTDATSFSQLLQKGSGVGYFDYCPYLFSTSGSYAPVVYTDESGKASSDFGFSTTSVGTISGCSMLAVVRNNNLKLGDQMPEYYGTIVTKDRMNTFYPKLSRSEYSVDIGYGKNATAYYQPDGTINVYLCRGSKVYKYQLAKNDQGRYELVGCTKTYSNMTKFEELYDGYALITKIDAVELKKY